MSLILKHEKLRLSLWLPRLNLYFYNFVFNEFTVIASSIIGSKTRLQIVLALPQVDLREAFRSVSYTHLTLPTKRIV